MSRSLSQILAPVHEEFRASGVSEEDLDRLLRQALAESRSQKFRK